MLQNMIFASLEGLVKKDKNTRKKENNSKFGEIRIPKQESTTLPIHIQCNKEGDVKKKTNIRIKGERSTTTDYFIHIIYKRTDYSLRPPLHSFFDFARLE